MRDYKAKHDSSLTRTIQARKGKANSPWNNGNKMFFDKPRKVKKNTELKENIGYPQHWKNDKKDLGQ